MKIASFNLPLCHSLKNYSCKTFLSIELIAQMNKIHLSDSTFFLRILATKDLRFRNHSMFFKLVILLSGDIHINPGPDQINVSWETFKNRGLHFLHVNANCLLRNIDEIRYIARCTNAAVIGITESKLDDSVLNNEINIPGYDVLRCDRNRSGGGVAC